MANWRDIKQLLANMLHQNINSATFFVIFLLY